MRPQLLPLLILGLLLGTAPAEPLAQTRPDAPPLSPVLVVVTPVLDFGDVTLGASDTLYATLTNTGDEPLGGTVTVSGTDFMSFTLPEGHGGIIDPGDTARITVVFTPQSPGAKSATLEYTGNMEGGPFFTDLAGYGVQRFPDLFHGPAFELDFSLVGGLSGPTDVALNNRERLLYVADTGNNRIIRWEDDEFSSLISVVDLGPITLNAPRGVAAVSNGDLFISDAGNNRLVRVSGGIANVVDMSAIGGLSSPWHIIEGDSSSVYIADLGNDRIVQWAKGVALVFPITGLTPPLDNPTGLNGDDDTGYVTEQAMGRLLRFVGESTRPDLIDLSGLDPPATGFTDIAIERDANNVFVTDGAHSRLLMFRYGLGPPVRIDLFRDLNPADLSGPDGLDITDKGDVLIADTGNNRILVLPGVGESGRQSMSVSPPQLFFNQIPVGGSIEQTLTLHNDNDHSVYVSGIAVWGGEGSFFTEQGPFFIAPFSDRPLMVTFAPQTGGDKFATLIIWHDAGDSIMVPLFGFAAGQSDFATLKLGPGYAPASPTGFSAPNFGAPGEDADMRFSLLNRTGRAVGGLQFTFQFGNAADIDKLDLVEIRPSETLIQYGFTLYTNPNLKGVDADGDSVPAIRIVVAPQVFGGIGGGVLPSGNIHLGNVIWHIRGNANSELDRYLLGQRLAMSMNEDALVSDEFGYEIPIQRNDRDAAVHIGIRGDISRDGRIDIRDVVLEVRVILGYQIPVGGDYEYRQPVSTTFIIADMQPDGDISVLDVISQINHILGIQSGTIGSKPVAGVAQTATISLGNATLRPDGQTLIPVMIDADEPLAGAEFTFVFDPTKLKVGAPELAVTASTRAMDYRIADGALNIVIYSLKAEDDMNDGPALWIPVTPINGATAPTLTLTGATLGTRNAETVTAILVNAGQPVEARPSIPGAYALLDAQPNPFNPATTIRYALPEQTEVTLTVYNILGQEVRTLVRGVLPAGYHSVVWDGRDNAGTGVGSGVYVYRLTTGAGYSAFRRMTLVK